MKNETAIKLCKLNNDFYQEQAASFSDTRQASWNGWERCLTLIKEVFDSTPLHLSILDVACGNLRFELFMQEKLPEASFDYYTVDNCDDLVPLDADTPEFSELLPLVQHQNLDICEILCSGGKVHEHLEAPLCDISATFGFMHHIPTMDYRIETLQSLIQHTKPGGLVIVSFWQFMKNIQLGEKAEAIHSRALVELAIPDFDANDYLLGWQNIPGAYRYCHSFTEEEIDDLLAACSNSAELLARFCADGRSDDLNTYLVLKVL